MANEAAMLTTDCCEGEAARANATSWPWPNSMQMLGGFWNGREGRVIEMSASALLPTDGRIFAAAIKAVTAAAKAAAAAHVVCVYIAVVTVQTSSGISASHRKRLF